MVNLVSIDWDYLVDADSMKRLMSFPDGGEISPMLDRIIWATHYATDSSLADVGVLTSELDTIVEHLQGYSGPMMVANSHRYAYELFMDIADGQPMGLINIDFHHDVYNDNEGLDCGNWVARLFEDNPHPENYYTWLGWPDSDAPSDEPSYMSMVTSMDSLIWPDRIDGVFIARSNMWAPPHLDSEFSRMVTLVSNRNTITEPGIMESRYNDELLEMAESEARLRRNF